LEQESISACFSMKGSGCSRYDRRESESERWADLCSRTDSLRSVRAQRLHSRLYPIERAAVHVRARREVLRSCKGCRLLTLREGRPGRDGTTLHLLCL